MQSWTLPHLLALASLLCVHTVPGHMAKRNEFILYIYTYLTLYRSPANSTSVQPILPFIFMSLVTIISFALEGSYSICHEVYLSLAGRWLEHWAHGIAGWKLCNGSFVFVEGDVYSQWMLLWGNPQLNCIQLWMGNTNKYQQKGIRKGVKERETRTNLKYL